VQLAFWIAFAAIAALVLWRMVQVERARARNHIARCEAAAAAMRASFSVEPPPILLEKLAGFDLTCADGAALPHSMRDVFWRKQDELFVFLHEHRGTQPGGVSGQLSRETVACYVLGQTNFPQFRLSPERWIEKAAARIGLRDLDFADYPEFSRLYYLNAEDEAAVRNLFGADVLRSFESHPGWHVEGNGDTLLVYRDNQTVPLEQLPGFVQTAMEIVRPLLRRRH
jgi:hypothetical protein